MAAREMGSNLTPREWMRTVLTDIRRQWLGVAFVFVTLATAIYSVEKVVWVEPQPSLLLTLLMSVLTTLLLTRLRLPVIISHVLILSAGTGVYIWQLSALVAPQPWWQALQAKPNESTLYFISFLIWGAWLIGYISTWFITQRQNAWVAIFLGAVVILVNLNNLPPKEYDRFFPLYVLAALLLLGYTHAAKQLRQLEKCGQPHSKRSGIYYAGAVTVLGVLVASSALLLPTVKMNPDIAISSKISWNNTQDQWYNIFAAVADKLETVPVEKHQNTDISFADPPSEDKTLQFSVNIDAVKYLRVRRYDKYLSNGWTSANTVDYLYSPQEGDLATDLLARKELSYSVSNKNRTDIVLITGEMKTTSLPVRLQIIPAPASANSDIIAVVTPRELLPDERYSVTSWVSKAVPVELFKAGTDYPDPVKLHYLQLPATLSNRVKTLGLHLTEDVQTPYEKALIIKRFLQRFTYNVVFNSPPDGVDAVDYFLFEKKAGDCTYFASAMAVMLRSVGVPARISSGYRLLEQDISNGQYMVRTRDYHARTEVYFPGYGWIEFEVTPGLPGLQTEDQTVDFEELEAAANLTLNGTRNAIQKEKVSYLTYDEEGNLLDEFGNRIYQDLVNPGGLPPNILSSLSPNVTANVSPNTTAGAAHNATNTPPSANATANHTANNTNAASTNTTPPGTANSTSNISPNATAVLPPRIPSNGMSGSGGWIQFPPFLMRLGLISLVSFLIGVILIVICQLWLNRIKRSEDAMRVYSRMCMLASLSKYGPRFFETPSEYGLRLGLVFPGQGPIIDNITQMYGESQFGREKKLPRGKRSELEKSWFQLYPILIKRIFHFG